MDFDSVGPQALRQAGGQLLRAHEAIDARVQTGDDPVPVERGLERGQRSSVELVDRSSLVAQLAQPLEGPSIEVQPAWRARRDDQAGGVHLECHAGVAIGVEQLQRAAVESEQRPDTGVEASAAAAAAEAPEPADERRIEAGS